MKPCYFLLGMSIGVLVSSAIGAPRMYGAAVAMFLALLAIGFCAGWLSL